MKTLKYKYFIFLLSMLTWGFSSAEEAISDSIKSIDTVSVNQSNVSKHDSEAEVLAKMYGELLDIEGQIRSTHNWLVDLNFMSPGVERKIQQKINELNERLDIASSQLDSITDKDIKSQAKPYKVTIKESKRKLSKCSNLLKKSTKEDRL